MSSLNTITLLINGLTLALALGFLLIILWNDARKELNQFFAIFLFMVTLWNAGSLLAQTLPLISASPSLINFAVSIMELGFTGSSVAIYVLTAVLVRAHTRRFRTFAFASLIMVIFYQLFLIANQAPTSFEASETGSFTYQSRPLAVIFYLLFDGMTLYFLWRYYRKLRSAALTLAIALFVGGQGFGFFNPELQAFLVSINLSSIAALMVSFALLRQEIIAPLAERIVQVEAMHKVSLAITSHISLGTVLNQITTQAAGWLEADGAGIFLNKGNELELTTVYHLPQQFIHHRLLLGQGVAGTVAQTRQSIHLNDYGRDWQGMPDLLLAKETFGAVICTPLTYLDEAIGTLMVIAGRHGRLFQREDVHLLELLGAQAAVAIAHSRLFAEQEELTSQVEAARSQLETVLTSTQNPVVAVNARFRLVFANPAARGLFSIHEDGAGQKITRLVPVNALPADYRGALRELRQHQTYTYEVSLHNKDYWCHLGRLGEAANSGWVAVLNDVTQLKELDRLKSEMVRMTSHDLKNPLQAALANLDLLNDDLADLNDPEVHTSLNEIGKQLNRMHRIIRGILDMERLKMGSRTAEPCYPERIVENAVNELNHLANEKQICIEKEIAENTPAFMGDPQQFERALVNLLENALKFTPARGQVKVTASKSGENVMFQVIDNGIGIPPEIQPRVFERFFQGKQRGMEHVTGSGLGLSLVKAVVETHQGKVWLESEVGQGTTFFIIVPATEKSEE